MRGWLVLAVVVIVGLLGALIYSGRAYERECTAAGGKVVTHTSSGMGVSTNGKPGMVVTTTSMCLSPDGRILLEGK